MLNNLRFVAAVVTGLQSFRQGIKCNYRLYVDINRNTPTLPAMIEAFIIATNYS